MSAALASIAAAGAVAAQQTARPGVVRAILDGAAVVRRRVTFVGIAAEEEIGDSYFRVTLAEAWGFSAANWMRSPTEQAFAMRDALASHPQFPVAILGISATTWGDSRVVVVARSVHPAGVRLRAAELAAILEGAGLADGGKSYGLEVRTLERFRNGDAPTSGAAVERAVTQGQSRAEQEDPGLLDKATDALGVAGDVAQVFAVLAALALLAFLVWSLK